jgi:hypothetical protein
VPTEDFGEYDEQVIDLDYHMAHCVQAPASCTCVGFRGDVRDGELTLTRCPAVIIDADEHDTESIGFQQTRNSKQKTPNFSGVVINTL